MRFHRGSVFLGGSFQRYSQSEEELVAALLAGWLFYHGIEMDVEHRNSVPIDGPNTETDTKFAARQRVHKKTTTNRHQQPAAWMDKQ